MQNNYLQYISPDSQGKPCWMVRLDAGCSACQAAHIARKMSPPDLSGVAQAVVGKPKVELRADGRYWARFELTDAEASG